MTVRDHIPDQIKRASRSFGYALWLDDADSWHGLSIVLSARLTLEQRGALAWAALRALPDQTADCVCQDRATIAGCPVPSFDPDTIMEDATWHASVSSPMERKAYSAAHFQAMDLSDRVAFLSWANEVKAA